MIALPHDLLADRVKAVTQRLERFIGSLAAPGQAVTSSVVPGDLHQAILDQAEAHDATLRVLGPHRSRPLVDLLRDTTTERIERGSVRPVQLVNDPTDQDHPRILVPVGLSPSCAAALRMAGTTASDAELRSFHAVPIPFQGLTGDGPGSDMDRELRRETTRERDAWAATLDPAILPREVETISGRRSETMARMAAGRPDLFAVGPIPATGFRRTPWGVSLPI